MQLLISISKAQAIPFIIKTIMQQQADHMLQQQQAKNSGHSRSAAPGRRISQINLNELSQRQQNNPTSHTTILDFVDDDSTLNLSDYSLDIASNNNNSRSKHSSKKKHDRVHHGSHHHHHRHSHHRHHHSRNSGMTTRSKTKLKKKKKIQLAVSSDYMISESTLNESATDHSTESHKPNQRRKKKHSSNSSQKQRNDLENDIEITTNNNQNKRKKKRKKKHNCNNNNNNNEEQSEDNEEMLYSQNKNEQHLTISEQLTVYNSEQLNRSLHIKVDNIFAICFDESKDEQLKQSLSNYIVTHVLRAGYINVMKSRLQSQKKDKFNSILENECLLIENKLQNVQSNAQSAKAFETQAKMMMEINLSQVWTYLTQHNSL